MLLQISSPLSILLVLDFQVIVTMVDVLLKSMFSRRYRECVTVNEPQWVFHLERGIVPLLV